MSDYSGYSSHYAQAYYQSIQNVAAAQWQNQAQHQRQWQRPQPSSSYVPQGHSRCTYKNCTFTGAPKVLETHMMDRHLIYPSWWDGKRNKQDWDADPSLKGKKIPILGTNISLDKPEDLAAWIEERKKRWPTAARVEDKKRKLEEAIIRGQIVPHESGHRDKRLRVDDRGTNRGGRGQKYGRGRGRGRGRGSTVHSEISRTPQNLPPKPLMATTAEDLNLSFEEKSDEDEAPEVLTSKREPEPPIEEAASPEVQQPSAQTRPNASLYHPHRKLPKKDPFNPFSARPMLLHRLLLPEIRMTVSNLSQAIRFLVDNDFLEGYEKSPGAANEVLIQMVSEADEQRGV